jgi:hypothetical protein
MALFNKSKKLPVGVQRIDAALRDNYGDTFQFDGENFWLGANGSTVLTILYVEHSETVGSVHVNAHVVRQVRVTPALCHDLLTNPDYQFMVGRWSIEPDGLAEGLFTLLLGVDLVDVESSVDISELSTVLELLAETADNIDDDLAAKHGGKTAMDALGD